MISNILCDANDDLHNHLFIPPGYQLVSHLGWRFTSKPKDAIQYDDLALWDRHIDSNEMQRIFQVKVLSHHFIQKMHNFLLYRFRIFKNKKKIKETFYLNTKCF